MATEGLAFALGNAVRRRRRALGLTQKDFAKRAGVNRDTILDIEKGRVRSSYKLGEIAEALGLSVYDLMLEADASSVAMHPDVGKLARALMKWREVDAGELAEMMQVGVSDVERLVAGDAGPLMWGAAAVAMNVPPRLFETAAVDGWDATREQLIGSRANIEPFL